MRNPILKEVQAKTAGERFGVAMTLLNLSATLTRAEGKWVEQLIRENWNKRPEVQEEGFGA